MSVLNNAERVFIGTQEAQRAYVGATKVWEYFSPSGLSGLVVWLDAAGYSDTPATGAAQRMWAGLAVDAYSTGGYCLGTRFTPTVNGQITHMRWWHGQACGQTHWLRLWDGTTGAQIAGVSDAPGGTGGLREIALATPFNVVAGQAYIASYDNGTDQFAYGTLPANLASHLTYHNGCYAAGGGNYPGTAGSFYYADVVFVPQVVPPWANPGSGADAPIVGAPVPVRVASGLNGKPIVRFKPSEGRIRMTGTGVTNTWTCVYVGRNYGPTGGRVVGGIYPTVNIVIGFHDVNENAFLENGAWSSPDTRTPWTTSWKLYSADQAPTLTRYFRNGVQLTSQASAGGWAGTFALSGYSASGVEETGNCEVAEVCLYNRKLSDAERQQVEGYLRTKWGL